MLNKIREQARDFVARLGSMEDVPPERLTEHAFVCGALVGAKLSAELVAEHCVKASTSFGEALLESQR